MSKIYLDMDGVLFDFDRGLLENYGVVNDLVCYGTADKDKTEEQWALSKKVWECMNQKGFFRDLPPMEGYDRLYRAARALTKEVYILTAFPNHDGQKNLSVGRDKWDAIQEYLPEVTSDKFIFCERKDKVKYAKHTDRNLWEDYYSSVPNILVDDLELNCREWEAAGGQSVLFKDKTMDEVIWSMEVAYGI